MKQKGGIRLNAFYAPIHHLHGIVKQCIYPLEQPFKAHTQNAEKKNCNIIVIYDETNMTERVKTINVYESLDVAVAIE